jgi:hypothetical protein
MKYEVGQEVRIKESRRSYLWAEEMTVFEGKITGKGQIRGAYTVDFDEREFAEDHLEPIGPKFKKGDEVRAVRKVQCKCGAKNNCGCDIEKGFEDEITEVGYGGNPQLYKVGNYNVIAEQDLELVTPHDVEREESETSKYELTFKWVATDGTSRIKFKEDVMAIAACEGRSREERAQDNNKEVKRINEQIKCLKEEVKTLNAESKNLRAYETDRDETIAQIKLAKKCKQDEAEAILALKDKGITV